MSPLQSGVGRGLFLGPELTGLTVSAEPLPVTPSLDILEATGLRGPVEEEELDGAEEDEEDEDGPVPPPGPGSCCDGRPEDIVPARCWL